METGWNFQLKKRQLRTDCIESIREVEKPPFFNAKK